MLTSHAAGPVPQQLNTGWRRKYNQGADPPSIAYFVPGGKQRHADQRLDTGKLGSATPEAASPISGLGAEDECRRSE